MCEKRKLLKASRTTNIGRKSLPLLLVCVVVYRDRSQSSSRDSKAPKDGSSVSSTTHGTESASLDSSDIVSMGTEEREERRRKVGAVVLFGLQNTICSCSKLQIKHPRDAEPLTRTVWEVVFQELTSSGGWLQALRFHSFMFCTRSI